MHPPTPESVTRPANLVGFTLLLCNCESSVGQHFPFSRVFRMNLKSGGRRRATPQISGGRYIEYWEGRVYVTGPELKKC